MPLPASVGAIARKTTQLSRIVRFFARIETSPATALPLNEPRRVDRRLAVSETVRIEGARYNSNYWSAIEPPMPFRLSQWPMLDRLKATFAGAPRSELEQATLRVAIGAIVLVYLIWYSARSESSSGQPMPEVLGVAIAFFVFAVALTVRLVSVVNISIFRRLVAMVVDNAATSYCLMRMDEGGAVILGVYLFVTFGNGFRYGRFYLHLSQVMGLVGFSLVLMFSPFWSLHVPIGIGFLVSMVVLPFYVGVLAERISEARNRADDANKAKGRFLPTLAMRCAHP